MNARFLNQPDRDRFKRLIYNRRDELGTIIRHMKERSWYTDDAVLLNLTAAWNSLHAAVQSLGALDGLADAAEDPNPNTPSPRAVRKRA